MSIKIEISKAYKYDKKLHKEDPIKTGDIATFVFYSDDSNWQTVLTGQFRRVSIEAENQYKLWFRSNYGKLLVMRAR